MLFDVAMATDQMSIGQANKIPVENLRPIVLRSCCISSDFPVNVEENCLEKFDQKLIAKTL